MRIQTVLCPVDFSSLSDRELQIAAEVCATFEARLVLHHNLDFAPAALAKSWEWEETHPEIEDAESRADRRMQGLLGRLPEEIRAEAVISRGLVVPVLLHLVETLPCDLLVMGSHGWSTDEHASVADRILESCPCPVLTLRDEDGETGPVDAAGAFRLRPDGEGGELDVLLPTDFSETGDAAVRYGFELARHLPLRVHLIHVLAERGNAAARTALERLHAQVPEDLASRVECVVRQGAVTDALEDAARQVEPRFIVMGRHARGFWQHVFTRDHARRMLHRSPCPVFFAA